MESIVRRSVVQGFWRQSGLRWVARLTCSFAVVVGASSTASGNGQDEMASRGLAGVKVTTSAVGFLDGEKGILEYRGIPVGELLEHSTFLETAYLLIYGDLPSRRQLDHFSAAVLSRRDLSSATQRVLAGFAGKPPLKALAAATLSFDEDGSFGAVSKGPEYELPAIAEILGRSPTVVANHSLLASGVTAQATPGANRQPRAGAGLAEGYLQMLNGHDDIPPLYASIMDKLFIVHADHEMNASTFAALVTASTITGFPDAEAAADLTLNGRLHGGAADEVADMLTEVGSPENVAAYVAAKRSARQKIPGFGHRVYKVKDPRAGILQGLLEKLLESPEFQKDEVKHSYILNRYRTALAIENALVKLGEDKNVWPNVDLYSSILEEALGVPTKQRASSGKIIVHPGFSPTFALGRKAGRLARVREYFLQPTVTGDMFRPSQVYTGKREQRYVPMAHR